MFVRIVCGLLGASFKGSIEVKSRGGHSDGSLTSRPMLQEHKFTHWFMKVLPCLKEIPQKGEPFINRNGQFKV